MPKLLTSESPRVNCWIKFSHADTDLQTVEPLNAERCLPRNEWFPRGELVIDCRCDTRHFTGSRYEDAAFFPLLQTPDFCVSPSLLNIFTPFSPILVKKKPVLAHRVADEPRSDEEKEKHSSDERDVLQHLPRRFFLSITGVAQASGTIVLLTNVGPEMILFSFLKTLQNAENNVSERQSRPP